MTRLKTGEWVEVRNKAGILETLDGNGRLDGLPFMPQMFQYCGKRFQVYKRAHKTCDTVNRTGGRRVLNCVHLNMRCDGEAYGGCQASCLLFWKEEWLIRVKDSGGQRPESGRGAGCSEQDVWAATQEPQKDPDDIKYVCQATQLPYFTTRLPWWDLRQYVEDYFSRNVPLRKIIRGMFFVIYRRIRALSGFGRSLDRIYDRIQSIWGGVPFPEKRGHVAAGLAAPVPELHLRPGDLVRIKPYDEILATLDSHNKHKGLFFDSEAVPYCGNTFRVEARIHRFINEKTGRMMELKTPAVALEGVCCEARYSDQRMHCPRAIYSWWREIWLERVPEKSTHTQDSDREAIEPAER